MTTMTKEEQVAQAKKDIEKIFENYSIEIAFKEVESQFEDGVSFEALIKPKFEARIFEMRVEMIPEKRNPESLLPCIEFGESDWQDIDDETVWRWLFFEALSLLWRARA